MPQKVRKKLPRSAQNRAKILPSWLLNPKETDAKTMSKNEAIKSSASERKEMQVILVLAP